MCIKTREVKVTKSRPRFIPTQSLSSVRRWGILRFSLENSKIASKLKPYCSIKNMTKTHDTLSAFNKGNKVLKNSDNLALYISTPKLDLPIKY